MAGHRCVQVCVQTACAHASSQPTQETQAASDGKILLAYWYCSFIMLCLTYLPDSHVTVDDVPQDISGPSAAQQPHPHPHSHRPGRVWMCLSK